MAALVLAAGLVGWVLLGSEDDYTVTARLASAGSLVVGDQVRLGAGVVGSVDRVRLADDGIAEIRLRIDADAAPLPQGTRATIRLDGLAGVANRYVTLDRPLAARGTIPDGGTLPLTDTQAPVDFDAFFDALDQPTRDGLAQLVGGSADQYGARTQAAQESLDRFAPALQGLTGVADAIADDDPALRRLLTKGAATMGALSDRREQLTDLVSQTRRATAALAAEQGALRASLQRLPGVLSHGTRTFATLDTTLDGLDPLIDASSAAAPVLPGFLRQTQRVLDTGTLPLQQLATTLSRPGADNDLVDLLRGAPALGRLTRVAFPRAIATMDAAEPELKALLAYTPDLVATLSRLGQVSANYDANGHYVRIQPDLLDFAYGDGQLRQTSNAFGQLQTNQTERCPGGVIQTSAHGALPDVVPGCKPSAAP